MAIKITREEYQKKFGVAPDFSTATSSRSSPQTDTQNRVSLTPEPIRKVTSWMGNTIADSFSGGVDQAQQGYRDFRDSGGNPVKSLEGVGKSLAGVVGAVTSPLAPVFAPLGEGIKKYGEMTGDIPAVQNFANSSAGQTTARIAENVQNYSAIVGAVAGSKGAVDSVRTITKRYLNRPPAIEPPPPPEPSKPTFGELVSNMKDKIPTKKISADIMNRVVRFEPTDANKFVKLSGGKTVGQYLQETGNFGPPDKIITNETTKFLQSKGTVDAELAKLPGVYRNGALTDALKGLIKRAKNVSGDNVQAPWAKQLSDLVKAYKERGLTMEEINAVKRLYERNVKLGYNKLINGDKVEMATNIDNSLRSWQVNKASELGFRNIADLNKQTQISKFIIDKLGDKIVGQSVLNNIGLTDWVVLSGGDVTSISGFLTKQFFSSKKVQAKIAEMLNKGNPIKGIIDPDVVPTSEAGIRTLYPEGMPTQQTLPPGTKGLVNTGNSPFLQRPGTTFEAPSQNIAPKSTYNPVDKRYYQKGKTGGGANSSKRQLPR